MVQVLPYVPSFLEQATPHLGNIGFGIGNLIGQNQKQKRDQTLLNEIQGGQASPVQLSKIWSSLSPEARKTYEPFLASQLRIQENEQKLQQKEASTQRQAETEKETARQEFIPMAKTIDGLIDRAAYGTGSIKDMADLDASGFWYTDKVYTHFNKGVVSNVRFENMKNELAPNSKQRPSVNRARLGALNRMAGLPSDISSEKFNKILDKEIKNVEKIEAKEDKVAEKKTAANEKKVALTDDIAAQIFAEAGQDAEKARQIAKARGYEF